jgi:hypothetical protein
MRNKLTELGFDVPRRSYGFGDPEESAKKVPDAKVNSQMRGLSIPWHSFARINIKYDAKCRSATKETQYSSSSPRKRKREEHESHMNNRHEPDFPHPKRLSSRDEMPPPPIQRPPCREPQPTVPSIPKTRAPQYREMYERGPATPKLRDTFQDLSVGHTRPNQLSEGRSQDWETQPYLDLNTQDQSNRDYEHHFDHRRADDRPMMFADVEQHREYLEPTYAHDIRSSNGHQTFHAQPDIPRGMLQENIRPNLPGRPQLREDTQQHQQRQMRYPLRPVQIDQSGPQSSMRSPYLNAGPMASVSPLKAGPPTATSVSSPFFQRGMNAPRNASTRRPPSRAGNGEFMREHFSQHDSSRQGKDYSMRQKEPLTRGNTFGTRNGQQFSNRLQSSSGFGSFEQAPSSDTLSFRGPMATSRAPRDMQRPPRAYVPPLQYPITGKQTMTSPRNRITLPPSTAGSQDYGLANMRGFRGGFPQRAEGFSASQHSGYGGSRPLFSPVSRRSVRR